MNLIKDHIVKLLEKGQREDGRALDEYRSPIEVEYGVSAKSAEGSARVKIGETEVVAGVKLETGEPFPDTPDEGTIVVNAELIPMASPKFESGPPSMDAIEISRVVDRGLRECHAVDFKKLCIKKDEKIWMVYIDIYPLNDAGNLFDVCALAALAALKDAKFPTYDKVKDKVDYTKPTTKGLPMNNMPINITVRKIANKIFVDPTNNEEEASDARLSIAITEKDEICALQKGLNTPLSTEEIGQMVDLAVKKSKELRKRL